MPKAKKTESKKTSSDSKTKIKKTKTSSAVKVKPKTKKTVKKSTVSKEKKTVKKTSKAKPVIVDVIEDDNFDNDSFFSDEALEVEELDLKSAQDFFLDLEDGEVPRQINEDESDKDEISQRAQAAWSNSEANDKQKEFYNKLASEIDHQKGSSGSKHGSDAKAFKNKKSIRLYRNLAWKFLLLVGFLALVVFYFSFSKMTIYITPEIETTSGTLYLKLSNQGDLSDDDSEILPGDARTQVSGSLNEVELEVEKTYSASGEEYTGEEIVGKVKIVNNYNRSQALVATTRLLSPDNKQFRIKEAVNIPAGSQVEVEIYADDISREMAIAPTRFTIPGLWVGLQDKIYAKSEEAFVYKQKMEKYVKPSDIQLAKSEAYDLILEKAKDIKTVRSQDKTIYKVVEPIDLELGGVEAGDKVDSFVAKTKASVVIISLSEEEVKSLASTKLKVLLVPDDKELLNFNSDSLSYVLESYDPDLELAKIKVSFSGQMMLKKDAKIINKEDLVNLKAPQIKTYLKDYPQIGQYELKFYPSFVQRAPHLVDRIEIKIKK